MYVYYKSFLKCGAADAARVPELINLDKGLVLLRILVSCYWEINRLIMVNIALDEHEDMKLVLNTVW